MVRGSNAPLRAAIYARMSRRRRATPRSNLSAHSAPRDGVEWDRSKRLALFKPPRVSLANAAGNSGGDQGGNIGIPFA